MIKDWFKRANKKRLYFWSAILGVLLGSEIVATVLIPIWRNYFFDGVEARSYEVFYSGLWYFVVLMAVFIVCQGFKFYVASRLSLVIREGLSQMLYARWRKNLEAKRNFDYPDQRIQEDCRLATELSLEVLVEVIISALIIVGLILQMWGNWLLLGLSAGYTIVVAGVAIFFHRPMVDSEKALQRAEAGYRFELAKLVMGRKHIKYDKTFKRVKVAYLRWIKVLMGFTLFNRAKSNLMNLVPYLVLIPMYFEGAISFGKIMEGVAQFDLMVINASILIILYPRVTKFLASFERIKEFYHGLEERD